MVKNQFKVGDIVRWTSQASGHSTEKVGQIVAVIKRGYVPNGEKYKNFSSNVGKGTSKCRRDDSYVVKVNTTKRGKPWVKYYWPIVNQLSFVQEGACTESEDNAAVLADPEMAGVILDKPVSSEPIYVLPKKGESAFTIAQAHKILGDLVRKGYGTKTLVIAHPSLASEAGLSPAGAVTSFKAGLGWNDDKVFALADAI